MSAPICVQFHVDFNVKPLTSYEFLETHCSEMQISGFIPTVALFFLNFSSTLDEFQCVMHLSRYEFHVNRCTKIHTLLKVVTEILPVFSGGFYRFG